MTIYLQVVGKVDGRPARNGQAPCPADFRCSLTKIAGEEDARNLRVDATTYSTRKSSTLSDELEQYLQSVASSHRLTRLYFRKVPLLRIPSLVCRMSTLTHLSFVSANLTELPTNCLNKLTNLTIFTATENAIDRIDDGLFAGLQLLQEIDLQHNAISHLGVSDFLNESDLRCLKSIDLSYNKLTTLDAWPFVRARAIANQKVDFNFNGENKWNRPSVKIDEKFKFYVDLNNNRIMQFKNTIGINLNKTALKNIQLSIFLIDNENLHPMDIMKGWGFRSVRDFAEMLGYDLDKDYSDLLVYFPTNNIELTMQYDCDCRDSVCQGPA